MNLSGKKIIIVMPHYSTGITGKCARMNDILRRLTVREDITLEIISISSLTGGHVVKLYALFKAFKQGVKDADLVHFVSLVPGFPILYFMARRKRIFVGPNITGNVFPDKYLSTSARKAMQEEKKSTVTRWYSYQKYFQNTLLGIAKKRSFLAFSGYASDIVRHRLGLGNLNINHFPPTTYTARAADSIGFDEKAGELFKVLYVGRLDKCKGFDLILKLIELTQSRNVCRVEYTIIGSGRITDSELLGSTSVTMKGTLSRAEVLDLIADHHLLIQPSNYEAQSNTVLEALGSGVPVLSSDIPAHLELNESDAIRYFKCGDVNSLYFELEEVVRNYGQIKKAALNNLGLYENSIGEKWLLEQYNRVLASK